MRIEMYERKVGSDWKLSWLLQVSTPPSFQLSLVKKKMEHESPGHMKSVVFSMSPLLLASSLTYPGNRTSLALPLSEEIERHSALERKIIQGIACSRKLSVKIN